MVPLTKNYFNTIMVGFVVDGHISATHEKNRKACEITSHAKHVIIIMNVGAGTLRGIISTS